MSVAALALSLPVAFCLQRMLRPQTVADVGLTQLEDRMLGDKVLVDAIGLDDVVGDGVEDDEVRLRLEHHRDVGQLERAMLEGGQHRHLDMRIRQPPIGDARPQDRMHLRHVRAPQDERVGGLEVVVAAHRLVDAERTHEAGRSRCHAMARIGIEVVGAEAALEKLGGRVPLPDRPLAGAEHADRRGAALLEGGLELLGHDREGLVPGDGREVAGLVVFAVLLAQQGPRQPILAIHDLGEEIALSRS